MNLGHEGLMENTKYLNELYAMCMAYTDSYGSRLLPRYFPKSAPEAPGWIPTYYSAGRACALFYDEERGNSHVQNGSAECHSLYIRICQAMLKPRKIFPPKCVSRGKEGDPIWKSVTLKSTCRVT